MQNAWLREDLLYILRQMQKISSMGTNTRISKMLTQGWDVLKHHNCGMNLVCCILYALPKLLSCIKKHWYKAQFYEISEVEVHEIKIWWLQCPWHRSLRIWDNAHVITPIQLYWSVLDHMMCVQQNIFQEQVNVQRENAGTREKYVCW